MKVVLQNLTKAFPNRNKKIKEDFIAVNDFTFTVPDGKLIGLLGPSGCGKTFMVKQIASILNMDFVDIGYINEEYDILGFQTATGAYSTPNFYRCYKYGKIAFCDELDNGNSRATVKLNSFLSNNKDASYNFPNGENVKRHNNFRIIAAGNTAGNGADANYNTREKIEESVQQRFMPVYVGYDNYVEGKILADYPEWYEFIVLFRDGTDNWGSMNDTAAAGIITTRDTAKIKRYLDNKSFDMGKILDYEFIQTKDMEYLAFLVSHMKGKLTEYPKATKIFALLCLRVISAPNSLLTTAALIPFTLLQAILIPIPEPHIAIP